MMSALAIDRLHVRYREGLPVLADISLELVPGESVGLVAANGSGKTTLAAAVIGVIPELTPGHVEGGLQAAATDLLPLGIADRADHVAYTFQDVESQLLFGNVRDILELGTSVPDDFQPILELLGITPLLNRPVEELSAGESHRVLLACALRTRARVLIYDETVSFLDPAARRAFKSLLDRLIVRGYSVLLLGQRAEILVPFTSRLLQLSAGRLHAATGSNPRPDGDEVAQIHAIEAIARMPTAAPPVLTIGQLSVGRANAFLLGPIDLTIASSETIAIMGPNGCGKSTLLAALAGMLRLKAGTITPADLTVEFLAHSSATRFTEATIGEELPGGTPLAEAVRQLAALLPFLEHQRDPLELSFGQQRTLSFLCALAVEPAIIAFDEPEQGLDAGALRLVETWVRSKTRCSVVMVTHDFQIAAWANRVVLMNAGQIVAEKAGATADELEAWYFQSLPVPPAIVTIPPACRARLDARVRLALLALFTLDHAIATPDTLPLLLGTTVLLALLFPAALLRGWIPIAITVLALSLFSVAVLLAGLETSPATLAMATLRFGSLATMTVVLVLSFSLLELLAALTWFFIPARLALAFGVGLRFLPQVIQEAQRVVVQRRRMARKGRAMATLTALIIGLLRRIDGITFSIAAQRLERRVANVSFQSLRLRDGLALSLGIVVTVLVLRAVLI